jgi:trehalose/maltose transport system substrate-binding protein
MDMAGREGRAWVGAALTGVLLAACGGTSLAPAAGSSPIAITWLAGPITQDANDPRQVLIDAFEKAHPSITVELISGPTSTDALRDTLRNRLTGAATAAAPDVYLGDLIWPAAFAHDRLALPLSRYLPSDFWTRFVGGPGGGLVQGATYRGAIYAAPFFRDQGLLYYRRDLLQRAGMNVPTTWEQLAQEAAALQAQGSVRYGFVWTAAPYEGLTCVWTELMSDAGGQVLNPAGTRSTIDSPESLQALRFLRSLLASGVSPPDVATFQEPQVTAAFVGRQTAFARNWNSLYDVARTAGMQDLVGVAPLPTFAGHPEPGASTAGGWNLFVNPRTAHLQAALEFIRWMTDVDAQEIMAGEYHDIPVNAVVQDESDLRSSSPVLGAVARTTVVPRPAGTPAYTAVSRAVYGNVSGVIQGRLRPEDALSAASAQIDAALPRGSP